MRYYLKSVWFKIMLQGVFLEDFSIAAGSFVVHREVFRESVCVCFLPIHSGHQWTYQPGSHRRKVTQDF